MATEFFSLFVILYEALKKTNFNDFEIPKYQIIFHYVAIFLTSLTVSYRECRMIPRI